MLAKQTQNFANNQQLPKKLQLHNACAWTINKPRTQSIFKLWTYKFNQHSMKIVYTQLASVAIQHRNQISFHHVLRAHHCSKHSNEFIIRDKMIFNFYPELPNMVTGQQAARAYFGTKGGLWSSSIGGLVLLGEVTSPADGRRGETGKESLWI